MSHTIQGETIKARYIIISVSYLLSMVIVITLQSVIHYRYSDLFGYIKYL